MSYYFIANININDIDEYNKYLVEVDNVFSKFNGKYLAVDTNPEIVEGNWNYSRMVIIEFPVEEDLKKWYYSPEYQRILAHRLKAAKCDSIFVKGILF